ncbi:uncharacterized protein LOC101852490 [Aplysia californica]|uniref:Uncharacterized protein LOC101852490 n=1 Tax=Aplysia californica TaxID=6500 RepID=A0ABM1A4H5_APLCA|nr:uncharacterized protein LOC101852490 [Aplysia californica]
MYGRQSTSMLGSVLYVILLTSCFEVVSADRHCEKVDACSCRYKDSGGLVTMRTLASRDGTPRFLDVLALDNKLYSYNPCVNFDENACHESAICQQGTGHNSTAVSIADQAQVVFGYDGHNVQVSYINTTGVTKIAIVSYVCVEHLTQPRFTAYGKNDSSPGSNYLFQLESMCACENACLPDESEGLSAGSVLLIVFFVLLFVYLVLGTIHGKVSRNATGLEMLPNYEFWTGLPGMIREGIVCVVQCACCRPSKKTYDEV